MSFRNAAKHLQTLTPENARQGLADLSILESLVLSGMLRTKQVPQK